MKPNRTTPQLEAVYRAVEMARDHPSAREVFERVRQQMPRVSLGTVYRNLEKLSRQGRVRIVRLDSGAGLYDAVEHIHDHFICDECGTVVDIDTTAAADLDDVRLAGYRVRRKTTTLYGSCRDCSGSASSPRE